MLYAVGGGDGRQPLISAGLDRFGEVAKLKATGSRLFDSVFNLLLSLGKVVPGLPDLG